jgi:hypothetical protein
MKRHLGVGHASRLAGQTQLMQVMVERVACRILQVEMVIYDDYLGGERRCKAGRGLENKVPFGAAVQLSAQVHKSIRGLPTSVWSLVLPKRQLVTGRNTVRELLPECSAMD